MKLLSNWLCRLPLSSSLRFTCWRKIATRDRRKIMNWVWIVAILISYAGPVQAQHADLAKLKADAQKIVRGIGGDRAKIQAYCQISSLGGQIDQAMRDKDGLKAEALTKKMNDLQKTLGSDYFAFFDALNDLDQNSREIRDILPMFDSLNQSCPL